jgi:hypothetical protein
MYIFKCVVSVLWSLDILRTLALLTTVVIQSRNSDYEVMLVSRFHR